MKFYKKIILLFLLVQSAIISGQEIDKHQWKERVLILFVDDKDTPVYRKQVIAFRKETKGFKERKLTVYHITQKAYAIGIENLQWEKTKKLYKNHKKTKASFEIILIGLDGGIKLRQTKLLTSEDLYALIDAMPMRRNERK